VAEAHSQTNGSHGAHHETGGAGGDDDFSRDIASLRNELSKLSESVSLMLADQARSAQDRLREAANETYATMNEAAGVFSRAGSGLYDDAGKRMDTLAQELSETIRKAPLASLGIAAGLGLLYGIIKR
jgi:ElaB/YqjD/DUF883 family membrane-anchored ribosome-binding protein